MQVTIEDITNALMKWGENDLANKGSMFNQALVYFVLLQGKDKVKQLIKPLDMLSDNGTFDVDQLHTNLVKTLEKFGGTFHVNYLNYNFDEEDLERIFGYLRGEL